VTRYERGAADRRAAPRSGRRASAGPAPHRAPALWCYAAALSQPSLNPPNRSTHFRARPGQRERGSTPRRHAPRSRRGSRSCGGTVTIWGCFCPFVWRCDLSSCSGGTVRSERVRELIGGGGSLRTADSSAGIRSSSRPHPAHSCALCWQVIDGPACIPNHEQKRGTKHLVGGSTGDDTVI
jgi:hypothetical protein